MPEHRLPREYHREPTLLAPETVHAYVRELLDFANAHQTWGVEVADALVDLLAARLSDTHSALDPALGEEVLRSIQANWSSEPVAYVDALCTILANLNIDTRSFLREKLAGEQREEIRALLAGTLAELDRCYGGDGAAG